MPAAARGVYMKPLKQSVHALTPLAPSPVLIAELLSLDWQASGKKNKKEENEFQVVGALF